MILNSNSQKPAVYLRPALTGRVTKWLPSTFYLEYRRNNRRKSKIFSKNLLFFLYNTL